MHIGIGGNAATLRAIVEEAATADEGGLATYSVSNIFSHDAIGALTVAATQTKRIELLTAVVPSFPRHPLSLAQQALTAQDAAGGRGSTEPSSKRPCWKTATTTEGSFGSIEMWGSACVSAWEPPVSAKGS